MSFSTRTMTEKDWVKITKFQPHEFKFPLRMGFEFMLWLEQVALKANVPMVISSSYRDPAYNKSIGGAKDSAHTDMICDAVDIKMFPIPTDKYWNYARFQIQFAAMMLGCKRIGQYPNGSLHLDMTHDRRPSPRLWVAVDNPA